MPRVRHQRRVGSHTIVVLNVFIIFICESNRRKTQLYRPKKICMWAEKHVHIFKRIKYLKILSVWCMGAAVVAEMRLYALWSLSIFYFAFYFVLHGWMLLFSVLDEYFFFFFFVVVPSTVLSLCFGVFLYPFLKRTLLIFFDIEDILSSFWIWFHLALALAGHWSGCSPGSRIHAPK